jgi:4-amino-4-deoxychorismate lyase
VLAGIKHLNRLDQVLASRELLQAPMIDSSRQPGGYDDGIMLDVEDHVIETTCANIFLRIGVQWITPDLSLTGVAGVARALIIHEFEQSKELLEIRPIHWSEFCLAEEVFICNAVRGIWPVVRIEDKVLPIGQLTRYLQKNLQLSFV